MEERLLRDERLLVLTGSDSRRALTRTDRQVVALIWDQTIAVITGDRRR